VPYFDLVIVSGTLEDLAEEKNSQRRVMYLESQQRTGLLKAPYQTTDGDSLLSWAGRIAPLAIFHVLGEIVLKYRDQLVGLDLRT
jgi:hypothetical protein